jgi:hypothetical protein
MGQTYAFRCNKLKTPIVSVDRQANVNLFSSVSSVESYLEAIDIADGEYDLYDADGLVLHGITNVKSVQLGPLQLIPEGRWNLTESDPPEYRAEELAAALRRFLRGINPNKRTQTDDWVDQATLAPLLVEAARFATR